MTLTTLLVANRGEIALRVIRSARARGLRTVAVYSDADLAAPHVRAADTAVRLGPVPASRSYLDIAALLRAAERCGADAVHPGYGFLSERADFARAVTDAGLTFVGPPAGVIETMGRKDLARDIAVAAGVPVVPSDPDGFPVLVKAAAGGGGKGMRVVRDPSGLEEAVASARREALAAFGDDRVLLERYVERGRHVEVQVLADAHGHVVHLFERDCSAQRRHQKVLEESPAPGLDAGLRDRLHGWAVSLAESVGYRNAGTVEFLVDGDEAWFLEMNTRLQVEHPVTEAVVTLAGRPLDLVDLQLAVAAGEPLSFTQDEVACTGHAVEARVYAEDGFGGFLPQAGRATVVRWSQVARVDQALEAGAEVGTAYDPMLAKVVSVGPTREAARRGLVDALDDSAVLGLTTNLGFVRALVASDAFRDGEVHTAWLDQHAEEVRPPDQRLAAWVAAWAVADSVRGAGPFGVGDGWRLAGPPAEVPVRLDGEVYSVGAATVRVGNDCVGVRLVAREGPLVRVEVDGVVLGFVVEVGPDRVQVAHRGHTSTFDRAAGSSRTRGADGSDGTVLAPMPGTVLRVDVSSGDRVEEGQLLGVVEAMKMELALRSPYAGTVTVGTTAGATVALGDRLFVVEGVEP